MAVDAWRAAAILWGDDPAILKMMGDWLMGDLARSIQDKFGGASDEYAEAGDQVRRHLLVALI